MNDLIAKIISKYPHCVEKLEVKFKPLELLETECWPLAVEPHLIVNEADAGEIERRTRSIFWSFVRDKITDKRILDFGTGHSACWKYADGAALSLGYDIDPNTDAIHDWAVILENKPYDIIIMFDVLDHLIDNTGGLMSVPQIAEVFRYLKSVLAPEGKLFVRCHPWVSRHGTHAYRKKNKAFVQFLTSEFDTEPTHKFTTPNYTYDAIIEAAGFRVLSKIPSVQPVEPIFRSFESWGEHFVHGNFRIDVMSINFIDYILGH